MTQSFMGDKQCWMEHMALNSTDGMDPEGIRLRASEGLLGVDYFFPGYAVWAGLIEAAADLGYDTNNLVRALSSTCSKPAAHAYVGMLDIPTAVDHALHCALPDACETAL